MEQITIKNEFLSLSVLSYGAIIKDLCLRHKDGRETKLTVGFENPEDYLTDQAFLGACVGRYAGRISEGGFTLDGTHYPLYSPSDIHLHGGRRGFGKQYWKVEQPETGLNPCVRLRYHSPHMEEGYPGNLTVSVSYRLRANGLEIIHEAETDRPTVVNLVNHTYFKLDETDFIEHYTLKLNCREYLETFENLVPSGRILPVSGTEFDFLRERPIGNLQLDTPFVIPSGIPVCAELFSGSSGIRMKVHTNQPALVVYTPPHFTGICFETQNFPDAPNKPTFPSSVLVPGKSYLNHSLFSFEADG